jgi:sarcosine oxidase subunit gamma
MAEVVFRFQRAGLSVSLSAPRALVVLRGWREERGFGAAAAATLGGALPQGPQRPATLRDATVFWLAPTAWLLASDTIDADVLMQRLEGMAGIADAIAFDVTDARCRFVVAGTGAREALAMGTGIDLHPSAFAPGDAALTRLAGLTALLHLAGDGPEIHVYVERPAAHYLARWLEEAGRAWASLDAPAVLPR